MNQYIDWFPAEDQEAVKELLNMTPAELDLVQYTPVYWICGCKNCNRKTQTRDYGIAPLYYHKRIKWFNTTETFFLCAKHWKIYNHLQKKGYELWRVQRRLLDLEKNRINRK